MAPPRFLHHASAGLAILHKTPWRTMLIIRDKVESSMLTGDTSKLENLVNSYQVVLVAVNDSHFNFLQEKQDVLAILVTADEKVVESFTVVNPLDQIETAILKFQRALIGTALLLAPAESKIPPPTPVQQQTSTSTTNTTTTTTNSTNIETKSLSNVVLIKEKPEKKQSSLAKSAESKITNKKTTQSGSISSSSEASSTRKADSDGSNNNDSALPKPIRADDWVRGKLAPTTPTTESSQQQQDEKQQPDRPTTIVIRLRDGTSKRFELTSNTKLSTIFDELGGDRRIVLLGPRSEGVTTRRKFTFDADGQSTLETLQLVPSALLLVEATNDTSTGNGGGAGAARQQQQQQLTIVQRIQNVTMNPFVLFWQLFFVIVAFFKRIATSLGILHEANPDGNVNNSNNNNRRGGGANIRTVSDNKR
jgi:hypothetical protein